MSNVIKDIYEHSNRVLEYYRSKSSLTEDEQYRYSRMQELNKDFEALNKRIEEKEIERQA